MIKLYDLIFEDKGRSLGDPRHAIIIGDYEDWSILAHVLESKGYKFMNGMTFSGRKLSDFNPFKSDRPEHEYFQSELPKDPIKSYGIMMSYKANGDRILLTLPKKKLTLISPKQFFSRKNN